MSGSQCLTWPPSGPVADPPQSEIVGKALRVGPKVTNVKAGQRVGVGAQSYSCLECRQCKNDNETYCPKQMDTYGAVWPDTGIVTQGGYSSHVRTHQHWYELLARRVWEPYREETQLT